MQDPDHALLQRFAARRESLEYAWRIAGIDPDHAATYLHELLESKPKRNLIKKIAENRKAKDPAAPVGAGD